MPKYWVKNYFAHGRFPEVGQKQKRRRRLNDGDNNGQATHGARKHACCTQAAWAKIPSQVYLYYCIMIQGCISDGKHGNKFDVCQHYTDYAGKGNNLSLF